MKKHLEFYKQCMATGFLPNVTNDSNSGLCGAADSKQISKETLDLMWPTYEDTVELERDGFSTGWWGSGSTYSPSRNENFEAFLMKKNYGFTPLRQTIVLFMAAINNEL